MTPSSPSVALDSVSPLVTPLLNTARGATIARVAVQGMFRRQADEPSALAFVHGVSRFVGHEAAVALLGFNTHIEGATKTAFRVDERAAALESMRTNPSLSEEAFTAATIAVATFSRPVRDELGALGRQHAELAPVTAAILAASSPSLAD